MKFNGTLSEMTSWTACLWVRPYGIDNLPNGTIFSYCAPNSERCNTLVVFLKNEMIRVNTHSRTLKSEPVEIKHRTHLCVVASPLEVRIYVNASVHLNTTMHNNTIPAGGVLIVGQDQDGNVNGSDPGAPTNEEQGLHGEIEGLRLWNRSLEAGEIEGLYNSGGCGCVNGPIVTFSSSNSIIKGDVKSVWNFTCD